MPAKRAKRDDLDSYATKRDVQAMGSELRTEMGELRTELRAEMGELRTELRAEMGELRTELRTEMGELRTEIGVLRDDMRAQAVHFENVVLTQMRALGEKLDIKVERLERQHQELADAVAKRP